MQLNTKLFIPGVGSFHALLFLAIYAMIASGWGGSNDGGSISEHLTGKWYSRHMNSDLSRLDRELIINKDGTWLNINYYYSSEGADPVSVVEEGTWHISNQSIFFKTTSSNVSFDPSEKTELEILYISAKRLELMRSDKEETWVRPGE